MRPLADYTSARVALGLTGDSLPTKALLELRLAHARARDAVHVPLDVQSLAQDLRDQNWASLRLHSQAKDRDEYLRRPDRGRRLEPSSMEQLTTGENTCRICLVIVDGLSALAIHRHAVPLLRSVMTSLATVGVPAVLIVEQGRVAIGDQIGELLGAELAIVLIGERPGLSSPDSLGIYLTFQPRVGRTDAERNCISNIHGQGLSYELAAHKLLFLVQESLRRKVSGVLLRETAEINPRIESVRAGSLDGEVA